MALNYQTWDKPLLINEALFAQNGRCGYILKPEFLRTRRDSSLTADSGSDAVTSAPQHTAEWQIKITVISGQTIPKVGQVETSGEVIDPYVIIKVYGHGNVKQKHRTCSIKNNG